MIYAYVRKEDRPQLQKELRSTQEVKWYRRLKIIDLSSTGLPVQKLAEMFDLSAATVRHYIHRYQMGSIDALKRSYSPGPPKKIALTLAQWEGVLHRSPATFEKLSTAARNWTQELLCDYCQQYQGVEITQGRLCQVFKELGIKWNRGKLKVTSPDPLYTVKRERVEVLKKKRVGTIKQS